MVSTTEKDWERHLKKDVTKAKAKKGAGRKTPKAPAVPDKAKARKPAKSKGKGKDDKQIQENTDIILKLHNSIQTALSKSLQDAFAIGDLLFTQKELIDHGMFTRWCKDNLPFDVRTAQRYMKLFTYKKALVEKGVETITDAYHYIFSEPISDKICETDDSPNVKSKMTITEKASVDKIELPKLKHKGQTIRTELCHDVIDKIVSGEYWDKYKGTFAKIVIELQPRANCNDRIGEFVVAAEKYLRPGGKIIFVKV